MVDQHPTDSRHRRIGLRPMGETDLDLIDRWLREPHVAGWWLTGSTLTAELDSIRGRVCDGADPDTHMLVVELERPIGWAQWYRWADYPTEAAAIDARSDEAGIDYAIGEPAAIGRRLGTEMIAALVRHVRRIHPEAGILVGPDAENQASRAVLERNGFELVAVRPVATEATDTPIAIYRLPAQPVRLATAADSQAIAQMLDQFNREYDEPTPGPEFLATRISELLEADETAVLLIGEQPQGLAVLRFRPSLWSSGSDCNLAELYITPQHRGLGHGRTLMRAVLRYARDRGAETMDIGVDEPDLPARRLYESLGFTNRAGGPDSPLMFVYERDL